MYFVFVMFIIVFLSMIKTGVNYKIYNFNNYKVSILVSIPALSNTITSSKITSVFNLPLYYGKYFIYNNYGTFIFEVCMSILYICLFSSVASLLINLVSNKKNDLETNLL